MPLLRFHPDAGDLLFAGPDPGAAVPPEAGTDRRAAAAIAACVERHRLGIAQLRIAFDPASGVAVLTGTAPTQEAAEKAVLCCGNVQQVAAVDDRIEVERPAEASHFHDVAPGETLSSIAQRFYGDPVLYGEVLRGNHPMLERPHRIYAGMKLRVPAL